MERKVPSLTLCELSFEWAGLAHPLDSSLEGFLLTDSSSKLPLHIIAHMAFELVQDPNFDENHAK